MQLGLLEVEGMVAASRRRGCHAQGGQCAPAQSCSARPRQIDAGGGGDLAACRAALDAGSVAAERTGCVISRREIGRPEEDTQWLIGGFQPPPPAPCRLLTRHHRKRY